MSGHDEDAPNATDEVPTWMEVLFAAALPAAIFAGARGRRRSGRCRNAPYGRHWSG
jgi:hypothetical protein